MFIMSKKGNDGETDQGFTSIGRDLYIWLFSALLSIYVTCKLRKIPFRKYIKESLICYIKTGKPMLLKEYEEVNSDSFQFAEAA